MPTRSSKQLPAVTTKKEADSLSSAAASQAEPHPDTINAEHFARVQSALNLIEATPEFQSIRGVPPRLAAEGSELTAFSPKIFAHKMKEQQPYLCAHNLFLTDPLRDASPGVPIDSRDIQKLVDHVLGDVFRIPKLPTIEIALDYNGDDLTKNNMQRVSPSEFVHAMIFACERAIGQTCDHGLSLI